MSKGVIISQLLYLSTGSSAVLEVLADICQLIKAEFSKDRIIVLQTNYYDLLSPAIVMVLYFLMILFLLCDT